jgi:hypothetical protein
MSNKFKEVSFAALASLMVLGASTVAVVDKDQRGNFMELATNVVFAYGSWVAGTRQSVDKGRRQR